MKRTDQDTMGFPKRAVQVGVWPGVGVAVMTDEFCTGGGREGQDFCSQSSVTF